MQTCFFSGYREIMNMQKTRENQWNINNEIFFMLLFIFSQTTTCNCDLSIFTKSNFVR